MGYSISWLSVRGLSSEAVYKRLGLALTNRTAEFAREKKFQRRNFQVDGNW